MHDDWHKETQKRWHAYLAKYVDKLLKEKHMNKAPWSVKDTLKQRKETHGDFGENAKLSQHLKSRIKIDTTRALATIHAEALDAICAKIARICTGDPNHADSWHDIAGYALLVEKHIKENVDGHAYP